MIDKEKVLKELREKKQIFGDEYGITGGLSVAQTIIYDQPEIEAVEVTSGMYECFHCCTRSLVWQCDFSFEDFGYAGEGIVQVLRCTNCGAEVEYRISLEDDDEE